MAPAQTTFLVNYGWHTCLIVRNYSLHLILSYSSKVRCQKYHFAASVKPRFVLIPQHSDTFIDVIILKTIGWVSGGAGNLELLDELYGGHLRKAGWMKYQIQRPNM